MRIRQRIAHTALDRKIMFWCTSWYAKELIEEKIDEMIESKKELASNVIGSGGESWITEMSNEELLSILKLS